MNVKLLYFAFTILVTFCIISENHTAIAENDLSVLSPLKQFKQGISIHDVKCNTNLTLVIKSEDGSPACVKQDTVQKLVERNWGTILIKNISNQKMNGTISGIVSVHVYGGPVLSSPDHSVHYEVDVYKTDGITVAGKTISDLDAHYSLQLPAGNYIIYTYNNTKQEEHLISVHSDQNTIFNISSSMSVP